MALIRRSNEKIIPQPCAPARRAGLSPGYVADAYDRRKAARALRRGPCLIGNRKRLVGAIEKFDGHEDHLLVADIFQVMDLVLAGPIGLVPGLAGLIGIFNGRAVVDMLTPAHASHVGPEVIEHMSMKAEPLAGGEPDHPDPRALGFRQKHVADAAIRVLSLVLEFSGDRRRPC